MSVLVTMDSNIGDLESWERGHSVAELTLGLPHTEARQADRGPSIAIGASVDATLLKEALSYLDPNEPYPVWRDIVAAIGAASCPQAREIAQKWSRGDLDKLRRYKKGSPSRYSGPDAVDAVLDTMPPKEGGVGVGTIEHLAHEAGWAGTLAPRPSAEERYSGFLLREAATPAEPKQPNQADNLLPSYMGHEIAAITPPRFLIKKLIPTPAVGLWFGKFGSFKTTAALDLLDAVVTSAEAFGYFETEAGDVVFVAGEGLSGLKTRVQARVTKHSRTLEQYPLLLVAKVPRVDNSDEWAALVRTITARGLKPKLIVIDHLSIMLGGQDQNDATVATQAMLLARELSEHFGCAVLILAHAGKEKEREVRGSSAFVDNVDFAYELERVEGADMVRVRCAKMRDAEAPEPFFLKAEARHGAVIMAHADKDDARRAAGKQVGLRSSEVAAALKVMGACPGGANEWTGDAGGIPTKPLATEIARIRHEAAGDGQEPDAQEVGTLVTALNRDGKPGGHFDALVVEAGKRGRLWAIAPGPIAREGSHG